MANTLLAVNGTLMRGLELNPNMLAAGATFVREDHTDACYRIWSIGDRHPAMMRTPGAGSMGPKIEALVKFVKARPNGRGVITNAENIERALRGETGTWITH